MFLSEMVDNPACLMMFEMDTMQKLVDHMWGICHRYFVYRHFLPCLILNMLPLLVMVAEMARVEKENNDIYDYVIYYLAVIMFLVGTIYTSYLEYAEFKQQKNWRNYFANWANYYQLTMILINSILIFDICVASQSIIGHEVTDEVKKSTLDRLRVLMTLSI